MFFISDYTAMQASGYPGYGGPYGAYSGYEGYGTMGGQAGYEQLDDGPPGVSDSMMPPGIAVPPPALPDLSVPPPGVTTQATEDKEEPPPGTEDDLDDLRMLGIDVDDTAFVRR